MPVNTLNLPGYKVERVAGAGYNYHVYVKVSVSNSSSARAACAYSCESCHAGTSHGKQGDCEPLNTAKPEYKRAYAKARRQGTPPRTVQRYGKVVQRRWRVFA